MKKLLLAPILFFSLFTHGQDLSQPTPNDNVRVAGQLLEKSAHRQAQSIGFSIAGAIIAGVGYSLQKGGHSSSVHTPIYALGGACVAVGFGCHISGVANLKKAAFRLQGK